MPSLQRALTNDYRDCLLIKLDESEPNSPLIVSQEGYAPSDPNCRVRMFYLQQDGLWIDEISRSTLPDEQAGEIVFETSVEAIRVLSSLFGAPMIREIHVTEAQVQAYIGRAKSGSSKEIGRQFLARYRAAKPRD